MNRMKYNVGIDIGGTFTDLICVSSDGKTIVHKTLSTPEDSSIGFINGIREVSEMAGHSKPSYRQSTLLCMALLWQPTLC
jgi:N-methylhydantoinase A/oxoprolinase/acetone carboxylase beta subunit